MFGAPVSQEREFYVVVVVILFLFWLLLFCCFLCLFFGYVGGEGGGGLFDFLCLLFSKHVFENKFEVLLLLAKSTVVPKSL